MDSKHISIYDCTLRDGCQGHGVSFSLSDKLHIANALDAFGIDFIEGGWPGSNPKDQEFFAQMRRHPLKNANLVAFGSTSHFGIKPEDDPNLQALLDAGTDYVAIVAKSWLLHVRDVLKVTPEQNLEMIAATLDFLSANGRKVILDAEHFFDGFISSPDYARKVLETAVAHHAEVLVLCDTNGGTLPYDIGQACTTVRSWLGDDIQLGIHCHNDSECAVASSLMAVRTSCTQVQGCMNGIGERCGNANLCSIIPALILKMGLSCLKDDSQLSNLTQLSRLLYERAVLREREEQPYVGRMAFAHKGGMHVDGVTKNPQTFEHISPESVGNQRAFLLSEHSGTSSIVEKAMEQNMELTVQKARAVLDDLKSKEAAGYCYEAADASFKLLVSKHLGEHSPHFSLDGFRVIVEKRGQNDACLSEATIKLQVNGETELTAAEGEGPVEALDLALRKALKKFYPQVTEMQLQDFKVRIIDGALGTAAQTRVLIDSSDGRDSWGTVGMSVNIIEASWQALLDSMEYFLGKS